jgi:PIN domain nuclease of toxin-antitoxin system
VIDRSGFIEAPIAAVDAEQAAALEPHHRDPFDRMLVAQASRLRAVVVTRDTVFTLYGAETLAA